MEQYFFIFTSLMVAWSTMAKQSMHSSELRIADCPNGVAKDQDSTFSGFFKILEILGYVNLLVLTIVIAYTYFTPSLCQGMDLAACKSAIANDVVSKNSKDLLDALIFGYIVLNLVLIILAWSYRYVLAGKKWFIMLIRKLNRNNSNETDE